MSKSDKYQRFAEECSEIAQTAKDNQAKAVLLHMAQVWFRLAAEHAEHAKGGWRKGTRLVSALSINLICQFFPSFRHFFQNTSMALDLGLEFSEPYALFRKLAILSWRFHVGTNGPV
jgi:hypothetical protein